MMIVLVIQSFSIMKTIVTSFECENSTILLSFQFYHNWGTVEVILSLLMVCYYENRLSKLVKMILPKRYVSLCRCKMLEILWETICTIHSIWKNALAQKHFFPPTLLSGDLFAAFIYSHLYTLCSLLDKFLDSFSRLLCQAIGIQANSPYVVYPFEKRLY